MDIKSLQEHYRSTLYSLRRNGRKNKILLIILSFPAVIYAYYDINSRYAHFEWEFPHEYLYYMCALVLVVLILTILTINTLSIINTNRFRSLKNHFKEELFECIREQIPEIKQYHFSRKIHSKYFTDSGLYKSVFTDYIGDDLFYGEYGGSRFEICELHVFMLFKMVFDGLFIRILVDSSDIHPDEVEKCLVSVQSYFIEPYKVKVSVRDSNVIYLAVKKRGKFFEHSSMRDIRQLGGDIEVLTDVVKLTREIIKCCYKLN